MVHMVEVEVVVVMVVVHEAVMVDTRGDTEGLPEGTAVEAMVTRPVVAMEVVTGQAEEEVEDMVVEEEGMAVEDMAAVWAVMELQEVLMVADTAVRCRALASPLTQAA